MTALDQRPDQRHDGRGGRGTVYRRAAKPLSRSLALTGSLTALQAVFVTLVVVEAFTLLAWAAEPKAGSTAATSMRLAAAIWTTGLHTRVHSGPAVVGLPLPGLTIALGWLLSRSVTRLVRTRLDEGEVALTGGQEATRVALAVGIPLAFLAALVGGLAKGPDLVPSVRTAALGGLVVGAFSALIGVRKAWREVDPTPLLDRVPEALAIVVRGAVGVTLVLGAMGALLLVGSLLEHHSVATGLQTALAAGVVGGFALTVLQVALAPTAVVFAVAWLAGPGFALGAGTSVSPAGTRLGDVPALPLLAALPGGTHGPGMVVVLPVMLAGVAIGLLLIRPDETTPRRSAGLGALAGLTAAIGVGIGCSLVGGPMGSGRQLTVGPSGFHVALALAMELVPAMALGGVLRVLTDKPTDEPTAETD